MYNIFTHTALYHIYLLQLENYDLGRFLRIAPLARFLRRKPRKQRQEIEWTLKMRVTAGIAKILAFALSFGFAWLVSWLIPTLGGVSDIVTAVGAFVLAYLFFLQFFFIFLVIATVIILPVDKVLRWRITNHARYKLARLDNVTVVAVTGSYGKTNIKDALHTMLALHKKVVATAENYNTPLGVARTILNRIDDSVDVFIVEMGAYHRGDIKTLCRIARPHVAILNGINEAHLERFGSLENTVRAKFEIVRHAQPDALVILNADDDIVSERYSDHLGGRTVRWYSSRKDTRAIYSIKNHVFDEKTGTSSFAVLKDGEVVGAPSLAHIAPFAPSLVQIGLIVGTKLGIEETELIESARDITAPPHRLELIHGKDNVLIIDDSYNGNPDGAEAAIDTLARFKKRRKIYLTPGLVEVGDRSCDVHYAIGKQLASVADLVLLIETSVSGHIRRGLVEAGFDPHNIHFYERAQDAHEALKHILEPRDVILFQNDWTDNYL